MARKTTVLDKGLDQTQPHIHVLAIGVGSYPNIDKDNAKHPPLATKLTAPPAAAVRLAQFLVGLPPAGGLEVDTVEMALSPEQTVDLGGGPVDVVEATHDNIAHAFRRWRERCHRHRDSMGILYFCGHGLRAGGDVLLLPADYLLNPGNVYSKAINFSATVYATAKMQCKTQCYLIDACQTEPDEWDPPSGQDAPGESLLSITKEEYKASGYRCAPIIYASEEGKKAFAFNAQGTTPFCDMIMDAIKTGLCARKGSTDWLVNTTSLSENIRGFAEFKRSTGGAGFPKDPLVNWPSKHQGLAFDAALRVLPQPPLIETRVYFPGSGELSDDSEAYAVKGSTRVAETKTAWPSQFLWKVTLPAGSYEIGVEDPADPNRNHAWSEVTVSPVSSRVPEA